MAARSTASARKSTTRARKKTAVRKVTATRPLTTDTLAIPALRTGSPPVGTIGEDAIERLVAQWIRKPKQPADYARLPHAALIQEARTLLAGREDLDAFAAAHTPIDARALDYLEVLLRLTLEEPMHRETTRTKALPSNASTRAAMARAVDALRTVMDRAEACGRPLRMYELALPPWAPHGLITQLLHVVQAGRRRVEKWDDPPYALGLFTLLEDAALELEMAWKLPPTEAPDDDEELRTTALFRLLYDAITYMTAYGRAVFPADDPRRARYLLQHLFPPQKKPVVPSPMQLLAE